jgi:hypothetical protein
MVAIAALDVVLEDFDVLLALEALLIRLFFDLLAHRLLCMGAGVD